jgi:hypothetical protein
MENVMIMPHSTGHVIARDGCILRVDVMAGRWVASRFNPNLVLTHEVRGNDDTVHRQIKQWLSAPAMPEVRHMTRSLGSSWTIAPTGRTPRNVARAVENANPAIRFAEESR